MPPKKRPRRISIKIHQGVPPLKAGVRQSLVDQFLTHFDIRSERKQKKFITVANAVFGKRKDGHTQRISSPSSLKKLVNFFVNHNLIPPDKVNFTKAVASRFQCQLELIDKFETRTAAVQANFEADQQRLSQESQGLPAGSPEFRRTKKKMAQNKQNNTTSRDRKKKTKHSNCVKTIAFSLSSYVTGYEDKKTTTKGKVNPERDYHVRRKYGHFSPNQNFNAGVKGAHRNLDEFSEKQKRDMLYLALLLMKMLHDGPASPESRQKRLLYTVEDVMQECLSIDIITKSARTGLYSDEGYQVENGTRIHWADAWMFDSLVGQLRYPQRKDENDRDPIYDITQLDRENKLWAFNEHHKQAFSNNWHLWALNHYPALFDANADYQGIVIPTGFGLDEGYANPWANDDEEADEEENKIEEDDEDEDEDEDEDDGEDEDDDEEE